MFRGRLSFADTLKIADKNVFETKKEFKSYQQYQEESSYIKDFEKLYNPKAFTFVKDTNK